MTTLREIADSIQQLEPILLQEGGKSGSDRQRKLRRLTVRERLSVLLDAERPFLSLAYGPSAEKAARFVLDCNQTRLPLIFFQDVQGFMVGKQAEQSGIICSGAQFVHTMSTATVPKFTVIVDVRTVQATTRCAAVLRYVLKVGCGYLSSLVRFLNRFAVAESCGIARERAPTIS